jgi:hypothetical protein
MISSKLRQCFKIITAIAIFGMLLSGSDGRSQDKQKTETIQATAMGTSTSMGRMFSVNILIDSYSTPQDQKTLIDAFQSGGHDELVKTLSEMKGKGRVSVTGTVGYQIAYIRSIATPNGRKIRLITDRPIGVGEAYNNGRSTDYDLSAIEINIAQDQKKSDGILIVAGKFRIDKNKQIELESLGNPWRLTNVMERD